MIMKLITICALTFSSTSALTLPDRLYIDTNEMDMSTDKIYIHLGENVWIESTAIYRDEEGIFTLNQNVVRSKGLKSEYERKWKCPYCYKYWPVGTPCKNKDCPSKY